MHLWIVGMDMPIANGYAMNDAHRGILCPSKDGFQSDKKRAKHREISPTEMVV